MTYIFRFKNFEAAYKKGTVIDDRDYGSMPSAAQSTSSVAPMRSASNPSTIPVETRPAGTDAELGNDGDQEAGWFGPTTPIYPEQLVNSPFLKQMKLLRASRS